MTTATITSKGQVTIPKDVRTRLGIGAGDRVEFVEIQDGVFQIVAATRDVQALKGIVPRPKKPVTIAEMNQAIAEMGRAD
jgi:AbrB family looped-hinge helix DNA binding protein